MISTTRALLSVVLISALLGAGPAIQGCRKRASSFREGPVDLEKWRAVKYYLAGSGQPYANWAISEDKQSVTQTLNADASIFVSDRRLGHTSISGTWLVDAGDDDDFIGFVFAYQNPGRFYIFDWKGGTQSGSRAAGMAKQGMCVKVAEAEYSGPAAGELGEATPFIEKSLWHTEGVKGKVRLLDFEATEAWQYKKPYRFQLDFRPGNFRIAVKDGDRTIYDKSFRDGTYRSGRFGFYNYSQGGVVYRGFHTTEIPGQQSRVWAIILVVVIVLIIVIVFIVVRRAKQPTGAEQ